MGLLNNNFPDDLLELIRNAAQGRSQSANSGAGSANNLPSWVPRQQQRLPLSFAGPGLTANVTASSPSQPGAGFSRPSPTDGSAASDLSWLPRDWSGFSPATATAGADSADLTAQALRMKGVPEAGIAAATSNPKLMNQLIIQNFAPGSAGGPVRIGYASYGGGASGVSFGDSRQRLDPETRGLDDALVRSDAPVWGRLSSRDPIGLSAGGGNLYRADAKNPNQLSSPSGLFAGPGYTGDLAPKPSPTRLAQPAPPTQIAGSGPKCDGFDAGCHEGGNYGTNGLYSIHGKNLCESCAVKTLRIENLGAVAKTKILAPYIR
jgi:hypothetical protein